MVRQIRLFALALATISFAQCKAKEDDFFGRTFSCDSRASANTCGTDRAGTPMICFPGSQIGGSDFCAPACDPTRQDARFTCQNTASVQVCDLSSRSPLCPSGFVCRDAGAGQGVCVLPCAPDTHCTDPDAGPEALRDGSVTPDADAAIGAKTSVDIGDVVLCSGSNDTCQASGDGKPMVCVQGSSLGGQDFCAEACVPGTSVEDPTHYRCVDQGALLRRCKPSTYPAPAADCPRGLNCFRTNLLADEGVCLRMPVCTTNDDCADGRKCAATLLGSAAAQAVPSADLDHLNCMIDKCTTLKTPCGTGEGCLGTQYAGELADLCVPRCVSGSCPPNFSCATVVSGPGAQDLCLPGVPGARCSGSNCVVGSCEASGAGFSICTTPCSSDDLCARYSTSGDPFVCVDWGGPYPHCVTPRPFNGANCQYSSQCRLDLSQFCSQYEASGFTSGHGECRVTCKSDGTCDPQGGLPFACLFGGAGGCFPANLGVSCKLGSPCISGLSCQEVLPELDLDAGTTSSPICTTSCAVEGGTDADGDPLCNNPKSTAQGGFCARGTCRLPRLTGLPCERSAQCFGICDTMMGMCVDRPANPSGQ